MAFDHTTIAVLEELADVLATTGVDVPCVAITGIPTRGNRLAGVLAQVLAALPSSVQVLIDVREPAGSDLAENGAAALRGLIPLDRVDLWGVPCLRLRRGPDPEAVPDLGPWRVTLRDRPPTPQDPSEAARRQSAEVQVGPLRDRVSELEREVEKLRENLSNTKSALGGARAAERAAKDAIARLQNSKLAKAALWAESAIRRGTGASSPVGRLLRALGVALIGGGLLGAVAVVIGELTDTGYVGGAVTAVLGLLAMQMAYLWQSQTRMRRSIDRTVKRIQEGVTTDEATLRRHAQLQETLIAQQARLKEIEHDLAIIAASTVDVAQSVARLHADTFDPGAEGTTLGGR
jgi:cell division protein FtsB